MDINNFVKKSDLIELLERDKAFDKLIFETFDGDAFAESNEELNISGLKDIIELLIPKRKWFKYDCEIDYSDLTIVDRELDNKAKPQLRLNITNEKDTFITTTESVNQLFEPIKMSRYAQYLLENKEVGYKQLLENFNYWFKEKKSKDKVLVRIVVEDQSSYIARCFASPQYKSIDSHILLYITAWALDKLNVNFRIQSPKISHSEFRIDFISENETLIPQVGFLTYGFKVINNETKGEAVKIHPYCELTNLDGTAATLISEETIKIIHRGRSINLITQKLLQLNNIKDYVKRSMKVIEIARGEQINETLAYKILMSIKEIIGKSAYQEYEEYYLKEGSNTYNLLQFFGRLQEIPVDDDDKKIEIQRLFWTVLSAKYEKKNKQKSSAATR